MRVIVPSTAPTAATFTRASTATYVDETGVVMTSSVNQPRYQDGRLLLEGAASNLLQYSEDFRSTGEVGSTRPWAQQILDTDLQVNLVSTLRPDGTTANTSKMALTIGGAAQRQIAQSVSGLADNAVVTFSLCLKAAEVPRVALFVSTKAGGFPQAVFNLLTGAVVSSSGTVASGVQAVSGGWYRCWLAVNVGSGGSTPSVTVQLRDATSGTYGGAAGDGLFLWGAQLEVASAPTSYIPRTGTTAASRAADSFSGEYMISFAGTAVGLPIQLLDEDASAAWVSGTTYAVGDLVHLVSTHRVYRRAVAGAGTTSPSGDTANWQDLRSTQRWAPLVLDEDTRAIVIGNLYITLTTAEIGAGLVLGGIRASSVRVVAVSSGSVVFDQSYTMPVVTTDTLTTSSSVGNEPVLAVGLPSSLPAGSTVHVSLIGSGSGLLTTSWLRYLALGQSYTLGGTLQGSRIGIADYSRKETDEFGTTTLVQRAYAKRLNLELTLPNSQVQATFSVLADLRATPAMWVPAEGPDLSWLATYGWVKDWGITVAYSRTSLCTLEIEGLI